MGKTKKDKKKEKEKKKEGEERKRNERETTESIVEEIQKQAEREKRNEENRRLVHVQNVQNVSLRENDVVDVSDGKENNVSEVEKWEETGRILEVGRLSLLAETSSETSCLTTSTSMRSMGDAQLSQLTKLLFKRVKFLEGKDMEYDTRVCKFVMRQFKLSEETNKAELWYKIRGSIKKKMDYLRNAASMAIKEELMSKCCCGGRCSRCYVLVANKVVFDVTCDTGWRAEREDGLLPYTFEDFKDNRNNHEAMTEFCERFLPCVVGKWKYKREKVAEKVSRIATRSDEAFALLILDNVWEMVMREDIEGWKRRKYESKNGRGSTTNTEGGTRRKSRMGKYTQNSEQASKYNRWTPSGLNKFNAYMEKIERIRETSKSFDDKYQEWCKSRIAGGRGLKRRTENAGELTAAKRVLNDLDDFEDDNEKNGSGRIGESPVKFARL